MKGTLTQKGVTSDATREAIEQAAASQEFFWLNLDIHDPGPDDDVTGLLCNTFHFHPVAGEAVARFGARARIDHFDDFVRTITFGMAANGQDVAEVHCFLTDKCLISLHQGDCPALNSVCDRVTTHHSKTASAPQAVIFYMTMATL